jgi:hypothetical protein
MSARMHASAVIARRQAFETMLSPGLYVTLAAGLLMGFFLVSGFTSSIDSAGFNPLLNPLYELISRILAGSFGEAFVAKLFAEGPYTLALIVSFLPVFLFLSISSVFRFGQEKNAGAIELLTYGPSDGTSYFVASFLKDVVFTAAALLLIAVFLWITAGAGNLVLGPQFLVSLPLLFLLSLAASAYGILCSILSSNASAALASFLGILVIFLLVLAGTFAIAGSSVRSVASVVAAVVQWLSPFYYAALCARALQAGNPVGLLGSMGLLILLSAVILVVSHFIIRRRGVRA